MEENDPPSSRGNGVKGVGICSILLPFFGLAESPQQKQNAVTAQPKIGIWPSWGVQEPGAAVQYSKVSWERELKITTRWLMILRAIVKLSSCDINQNMNISAVQGRKSPWRCTLGICHYWVARHALGAGNFSCESCPFGKPAFSSVRWHSGDGIHEAWEVQFSSTKPFSMEHIFDIRRPIIILSQISSWFSLVGNPLQTQHSIFLNLAVLGFYISLPKANTISTTFQLGFITIIIKSFQSSLRYCHPVHPDF